MPKYIIDKCTPKNVKDILGDHPDKLKELYGENYFDWRYGTKLFFHKKLLTDLQKISKNDDFPHIIFYGAGGSGKKTIINLFLEMIFGDAVYGQELAKFPIQNSVTDDFVEIKQSMHHIVIEPNNNNSDRYLVQDVIKQYITTSPLRFSKESKTFKVVQINNLDDLTRIVQTSLRCTIENYSKSCRFIMSCTSLSKVIPPLRSRCVCINIPSQNEVELIDWLTRIALMEKIKIDQRTVMEIICSSDKNLKDIIWRLELYKRKKTINNTYHNLLGELKLHFIKNYDIMNIREIIYKIYTLNKQTQNFIVDCMNMILKNITDLNKAKQIVESTAKFEHRLTLARHDVVHLEAYVISVLHILYYNK